jgi:hypothetical protein
MYVFKNTTLLAYRSNRFREIRTIPIMSSIYASVTQQRTTDLFKSLYDTIGPRGRISKDSTSELIELYATQDRKVVRLTNEYFTEGGSPDSVCDGTECSDPDCICNDTVSLLKFAIIHGSFPLARLVLSEGAGVDYGPPSLVGGLPTETPLALAVNTVCARADIVELLMQNGADLYVTHYGHNLEQITTGGNMSWVGGDMEQFEKILVMIREEPARRANESKRQAFAMVLHERLGADSWVNELDPGVVRLIIDSV